MLVNITFKNYLSFLEDTSISFVVGKKAPESYWDSTVYGHRLNKVAAILGPNASGKTNILRAIDALAKFVPISYTEKRPDESIPLYRHSLGPKHTSISVNFLESGTEYRYELEGTNTYVTKESLYKRGESGKFSYIFRRKKIGNNKYEVKQNKFGFDKRKAADVPKNLSLVGAANSFGVPLAKVISSYFINIKSNMFLIGRQSPDFNRLLESSKFFSKNPEYSESLIDFMQECDFGMTRISFENLAQAGTNEPSDTWLAIGHHKSKEKEFALPFLRESNGTQAAFVLLEKLLPILKYGGVAVIDELDNDLHPHLLPHILDFFKHKETNPNDAQLIFTCHTPEILNVLSKHQVYLTEKRESTSNAWDLSEIKGLRSDDNRYAKYMAGALGGIPNI